MRVFDSVSVSKFSRLVHNTDLSSICWTVRLTCEGATCLSVELLVVVVAAAAAAAAAGGGPPGDAPSPLSLALAPPRTHYTTN